MRVPHEHQARCGVRDTRSSSGLDGLNPAQAPEPWPQSLERRPLPARSLRSDRPWCATRCIQIAAFARHCPIRFPDPERALLPLRTPDADQAEQMRRMQPREFWTSQRLRQTAWAPAKPRQQLRRPALEISGEPGSSPGNGLVAAWRSESWRNERSIQPQPTETDHQLAGGVKQSVQIGPNVMFPVWLPRKTSAGPLGLNDALRTIQPASRVARLSCISLHAEYES